ncbi:MAG: hypothetical protein QXX08_02560 [Candidatus Bathyarchaeia archaeon]
MKIAEILQEQGFNIQLLSSKRYILNKMRIHGNRQIATIKEAFIKHNHVRFVKNFFPYQPFGNKEAYIKELLKANTERLTHLIKVCSFLLQTKVYLFWKYEITTT